MCQISSKKNALFQFTGKKYEEYLLESMGFSNHLMISVLAGNLGREIVLMFHDSQLGIVKEKKLSYKKLKKPQTPGYFWRKRFKVWLDGENIVVPLDHYKIPDSIRSNFPLFGIFPEVWSNLKAQIITFKYGSETLEFETDTVEFKINPIRGNTQIGNWHQANEFELFY